MAAVMAAVAPLLFLKAVMMHLLLDRKSATVFEWSGVPFGV